MRNPKPPNDGRGSRELLIPTYCTRLHDAADESVHVGTRYFHDSWRLSTACRGSLSLLDYSTARLPNNLLYGMFLTGWFKIKRTTARLNSSLLSLSVQACTCFLVSHSPWFHWWVLFPSSHVRIHPCFTAGKWIGVWNCYTTWGHRETTIFTSIVYDVTTIDYRFPCSPRGVSIFNALCKVGDDYPRWIPNCRAPQLPKVANWMPWNGVDDFEPNWCMPFLYSMTKIFPLFLDLAKIWMHCRT